MYSLGATPWPPLFGGKVCRPKTHLARRNSPPGQDVAPRDHTQSLTALNDHENFNNSIPQQRWGLQQKQRHPHPTLSRQGRGVKKWQQQKKKGSPCGLPFFVVCRACLVTGRWKSSAQPDGGEGQATGQGDVVRRRLKAAIAKMWPDGQEPDTRPSRPDERATDREVHNHQVSRR